MILSYNVPQNKEDSDDSGKEENLGEIKLATKDKKKKKEAKEENNKSGFSYSHASGWDENNVSLSNSSQISNIEHKNSSISSSMRDGLSKGEDCIQKDVLLIIDEDSPIRKKQKKERYNTPVIEKRSSNEDDKIIDISNEMSFNSQKSKNYILKSSLYQSKDKIKGNKSKENSLNKCLNYYITKPNQKESNLPDLANAVALNYQQNQTGPLSALSHAGPQMFLKNETDGLINQMEYFSLQQREQQFHSANTLNSNYPNAFPNQINKGRLNAFNSPSPKQQQQLQPQLQQPSLMQQQGEELKPNFSNNQFFKQPKTRPDPNNESDLIFNCINYSKEQTGCRLLQKKIEENPSIVNDTLFAIVKSQLIDLSCDSFGNYFIQKIIQYLNSDKLEEVILRQLPSAFRMMSFNPHGTRVIQKMFERAIKDEKLLKYYNLLLKPNMKDFIVDPNASHIIIQYVSLVPSPGNDFIVEFLCQNTLKFATQKHSCCALQKCIEYVNPQQKKQLFLAVAHNSFQLFTDQFGNYVVQFVVNACDFEINHLIMVNFLQDFKRFSVQKYSSNVIEKCLSCCSEETKQLIVEHLCNAQIVQHLLFDMYGNYVLQKGMTIANEPYRAVLFGLVKEQLERLQFVSFGPKLYNRLISTFPELSKTIKNDKGLGPKKVKNKPKQQMDQQPPFVQPQLNSFQNFGNVFYQAHPMYNPYQPMPNAPMNSFPQLQYMQQVLNQQGMYMPMPNGQNSTNSLNSNMNYTPNFKPNNFGSNAGSNFKSNFYQ